MPKIVYLNRCVGDCQITGDVEDDARQDVSRIVFFGVATVSEFALGDDVWNATVRCMREVWSPYGITFTETRPAPTEVYGEAVIAGVDREIGVSALGIAPIDEFCRPLAYAISFTFANTWLQIGVDESTAHDVCRVASQEIAHTYGLDHIFQYYEGDSSCPDPMTYRDDECGGQRFFRNRDALCGEFDKRPCRCGPNQRSHALLLGKLGPGTPTTTTEVALTSPATGATITQDTPIVASGFSQRGVSEVTFRLNGYPWGSVAGAPFGPHGQLRSDYRFTLPAEVPDGVIDIEATAVDDIGVSATSTITVIKGAPCVTEDSCATGQFCDAGRCIWPEPSGEVGDACSYPQFCIEPRCESHGGESHCTRTCVPGLAGSCGDPGLDCVDDPDGAYCWPIDGGCCSASRGSPWGVFAVAGLVAFAIRRRRR